MNTNKQPQQPIPLSAIQWAMLGVFAVALLLTAFLTFRVVRDLVASWELTALPGIAIQSALPTPGPGQPGATLGDVQTPLQAPSGPAAQPWDGASRVTLLVMGLDYGDWASPDRDGPPKTDSMILLTVDPLTMQAGILSIPRDLWVNIPGYGYGRINTAYALGEANTLPGGGPGLAMKTVSAFLGVPIDYYAQIDFSAFVSFIDEIGGVKIDVPAKITVDLLGDNTVKTLKPGRQTLPGDIALAYARARKTEGGDFDRAQRQQQIILGIRERILSADMLPLLISKAPVLYQQLSAGVNTNLTLDQAIRLAWLAQQIPIEKIQRGTIAPPEQVNLATMIDGQQVLKPITEKIRLLRDDLFAATSPTSPISGTLPLGDIMKIEAARVAVRNSTSTAGLAARTTEYLQSLGVNVTETGNGDQILAGTTIIDYTGKPYTLKYLIELFRVADVRVYSRYDPASPVDVVVLVGEDWAASNPMP